LLWVDPLQLSCVEPQLTVADGKTHPPVRSAQSVAPHGGVTLLQAALQQWPVPLMPQTPEAQAAFSVQAPVAMVGAQAPALQ
jgi:hypothetical protein